MGLGESFGIYVLVYGFFASGVTMKVKPHGKCFVIGLGEHFESWALGFWIQVFGFAFWMTLGMPRKFCFGVSGLNVNFEIWVLHLCFGSWMTLGTCRGSFVLRSRLEIQMFRFWVLLFE